VSYGRLLSICFVSIVKQTTVTTHTHKQKRQQQEGPATTPAPPSFGGELNAWIFLPARFMPLLLFVYFNLDLTVLCHHLTSNARDKTRVVFWLDGVLSTMLLR
jgi:hypothetical protein